MRGVSTASVVTDGTITYDMICDGGSSCSVTPPSPQSASSFSAEEGVPELRMNSPLRQTRAPEASWSRTCTSTYTPSDRAAGTCRQRGYDDLGSRYSMGVSRSKRRQDQVKTNCYAQSAQIRKIRAKIVDICIAEASKCMLREVVKKLRGHRGDRKSVV